MGLCLNFCSPSWSYFVRLFGAISCVLHIGCEAENETKERLSNRSFYLCQSVLSTSKPRPFATLYAYFGRRLNAGVTARVAPFYVAHYSLIVGTIRTHHSIGGSSPIFTPQEINNSKLLCCSLFCEQGRCE